MPIDKVLRGLTERASVSCALLALSLCAGTAARAEAPLSAIDWLSQSVAVPVAQPLPPEEPAVSAGALPADVAVSTLDGPAPDAAGLLSPQATGLPRALWGLGRTDEIAAALTAADPGNLPALQSLLLTLLLAEAEAPADAAGRGVLLLARIDRLLAMGALDQAQALLEAGGSQAPDFFRRSFDVALLTGTEDRACEVMQAAPDLAPTFPARIFCLARSGDWNAAALTLRTAQALGFVTEEEDALLSRFLDPDLYEGEGDLPAPARPTPLGWRMMEAVGEPLSTHTLPIAFSHAELRDAAGWKAQIEAAERLARAGAIEPNLLLGLYTERLPAASGGVWDRVEAFQRLDAALTSGNAEEASRRLPAAWAQMTGAELEVPFATLFSERLADLTLTGPAAALAFRIGLLSPRYERIAMARTAADPAEAFLVGVARGALAGVAPQDAMGRAVAQAFLTPALAPDAQVLLDQNRLGEALLWAMDRIATGVQGDLRGVTDGLTLLRHVGLEDTARRGALELLLLERRG
ncbi:hypothetical protein GEU84_002110 [Fertoebacter nigrum]|uniref:Uncharacterized protein n=1 Tax=Fertoeibacter niger TaxID=2656921 RepID=A0A8X8GXU0_9RHOB|nr:hypothetical protein [Fertoeibacter niger]NUB43165.1 hypothetical protein [Fertoeibacter niger]